MKGGIACVGAGPASLYFAILAKQAEPQRRITVFERQREGAALGWGVTLFLDDLDASDPPTAREIRKRAFQWHEMVVHVEGGKPVPLPVSRLGHSMGRSTLLDILVARARQLGVELRFESEIRHAVQLSGYDLVVAADGVGSTLREAQRDVFGTRSSRGSNKYIWLGTSRVFESFTFPFAKTSAGWLWAFAYGFDDATSTFIVETSAQTWAELGFDRMTPEETTRYLERLFAPWLDGNPLRPVPGTRDQTPWLEFQTVTNARWHADNLVLIGDAAHTTHFTIGSGTQLAIADAIALAANLRKHATLGEALSAYERERIAAVREVQADARRSARWFEDLPRYIGRDIGRDDEQFAQLLLARGSSLISFLPPGIFLRLRRAVHELPSLAQPLRQVWHALQRR